MGKNLVPMRRAAFHEGGDLKSQVEAYRVRHGCYPAMAC